MGITLGTFGAGGSILTVPLLTFLLAYPPALASHYSLFIVGSVSFAGVVKQWSSGNFRLAGALKFAVPAMAGMFLVKKFILPAIPPVVSVGASQSITVDQLILGVFAVFMILAAGSMMFVKISNEQREHSGAMGEAMLLGGTGIVTGVVSGFVGAGGGFLIVPALVFLGGFPVKEASRASLLVIAINSIWGFVVGTPAWSAIPFFALLAIIAFALVGMLAGIWLQERVHADRLKPAFGAFVLGMGIYILIRSSHG